MIVLGIASRSGRDFGGGNTQNKNFENAFSGTSGNLANYVESFSYILYSYSGFNHPFYVLNEAETPRKIYPIATSAALALQWLLFVLVNVAYIWVVDLSRLQATTADGYTGPEDMAALFFDSIFGAESPTPKRVMAGLLGLSILGNIIVMTCKSIRIISRTGPPLTNISYGSTGEAGDSEAGHFTLLSLLRILDENTMGLAADLPPSWRKKLRPEPDRCSRPPLVLLCFSPSRHCQP